MKMPKTELTLPQKSMDRLNRLVEITESGSVSEVIRNAIRLYEGAANEVMNGGVVVVIRKDGAQIPVFGEDEVLGR